MSLLQKDTIYVYNGPGVSKTGIKHLKKSLKRKKVRLISPKEVLQGFWVHEAALFIMPGGADIPYTEKLNGRSNALIRGYVENGGSYLGICAGAYYAGADLEFAKGTEIEVIGNRELSFFPGLVEGPTFSPYHYGTYEGARAAYIEWNLGHKLTAPIFYNGGCHFINTDLYPNVLELGVYKDLPNQPVAAIECAVGRGKAILSGVHFEYDPFLLDNTDQHLKDIIPVLKKCESERIYLLENLLNRLIFRRVDLSNQTQ
jgi:glutamine amidotransferase-like uncharacterized protein